MKHLFLFAVIGFLTIASTANAQKMMLGVRGGVNLANQHYDNLPDGETISSRTLGLGGAQLDYSFSPSWALSLQLLYDQKGAHLDNCYFTTEASPALNYGTEDRTSTYLEVPLVVKLSFGTNALSPYLFAGPSIGYLLSSSVRLQATGGTAIPGEYGTTYPIDTTISESDYTTRIDLSLLAGAGISWELTNGSRLLLDASYAYGLKDNGESSSSNVYSRDIRLAAGILFPLD